MVVAVYADHLGRGPTRVRSYLSEGIVTCLLENTLTRAEAKLVGAGRGSAVLEVRANFQVAMEQELIAGVEELTNRQVAALIGGTQFEPDVSSQVFMLDGRRVGAGGKGAG